MRLPASDHTSRPWRIHEIARDFRVEDVWELPTLGGPVDFPRLVATFASINPMRSSSRAVRALFAIRLKVGELLNWDDPITASGAAGRTLRDRLPGDLRKGPSGPHSDALPFTPLYLTENEWAVEILSRTVDGILHLGWVPNGTGGYRGQMAVLVKPNGLLGAVYMAAITPFRYLIVYPQLMRDVQHQWCAPG